VNAARPRILIADDSMVVRAVIGKQLGNEGFELLEAADGDAALAVCRDMPPDVVLLDVEMPGRTGYDVLSVMQADDALAGIPVIFLSGQVSAEHVATGLRLGAHDYLRKPVETGELLARVTAALRTKALQDRLKRDNAQLRQLAPIDPLTGVLDVRGLQERLEAMSEDSKLRGRPLAGVLLDVQGLDTINNASGWAVGDEVLRHLAELVSAMIGPGEVVGRCGPDEFLVLLPNTELVTAEALSRSLQSRVAAVPVVVGPDEVVVRISVGTAVTVDGSAEALVLALQESITSGMAKAADVAPAAPTAPPVMAPPPPAPVFEPVPAMASSIGEAPLPPPPPPMPKPVWDVPSENDGPAHAKGRARRWGRDK
jgi:diguanylate cyclase (GGDEF)-like protein